MRNFISAIFVLLVFIMGVSIQSFGQSIKLADGSALPKQYCWEDAEFEIACTPAGGVLSGCGVSTLNGEWFFNPIVASAGVTVFPMTCTLQYTVNGSSTSVTILIWKPVVVTPPLEDVGTCSGDFILDASMLYAGAYDYTWTPSAPLDLPDSAYTMGHINESQVFVLTAVDETSGCMGSDTVKVTRYPGVDLTVSNDTTINARGIVKLNASGAVNYKWIPSRWLNFDTIPDPIAQPHAPITYQVVGTNEFGCSDTASVRIDIREQIFVPNAFSPNGDGVNDVFKLENYGFQGILGFRIFNRWGQMIYQAVDGTKGWDGTYNGKVAEVGTYYYEIRLAMLNGTEEVLKGDLTLVR